ncbi:MAG: IS1 family transposase [Desulfococcaceae bacterium]
MNPHFLSCQNPLPETEIEIRTDAEADEFWSCAGSKKNQCWTWYAIERESGIIPAWHNGKRTDESCAGLFEKLSAFRIAYYHTDDWQSYRKHIPSHKHIIGKDNTWKIERKNLNFRTHIKRLNRKTICFSKNEDIHDNVIGMYINRYYFETGCYSKSA